MAEARTPSTPSDMETSEGEQTSSSSSTSLATASSPWVMGTLASSLSAGTDKEEEEEAVLVSGGATASGAYISMELELQELDASRGWPQALLKIENQCQDYPHYVARAIENRSRNRYQDVRPYDHSRIHLRQASLIPGGGFHPGVGLPWVSAQASGSSSSSASWRQYRGDDLDNDYINASLVVVEDAQRTYILTQSPLQSTWGHFWLMVWQQNSKAVIMLNQLMERGSSRGFHYWPTCQSPSLIFDEIGLRLQLLREEVQPFHTVHYLSLENLTTGEVKPISHFHYTSWPDFGVPESPASFLTFLFMVRDSGFLKNKLEPVVIHCSAGIGRSGTFTLIDACLVLMEKRENPFSLNIRKVLIHLRKYRMGLIQTPEQLRFSYVAIIEGAKFLMGDENIKKKWEQLTEEDHARSYNFSIPPLPTVMLKKTHVPVLDSSDDNNDDDDDDDSYTYNENEEKSDYSDLAVRLPDSGEESSGNGTPKRGGDECKPSTIRDGNKKSKITGWKGKRFHKGDV